MPNANQYTKWVDVTPSDSANFGNQGTFSLLCEALYIGGAGNVVAVKEDDSTQTFAAVAGQIIPGRFKRVNSTSTTATGIKAGYNL